MLGTDLALLLRLRDAGLKEFARGFEMLRETLTYQRTLVGSLGAKVTHQTFCAPECIDPVVEVRFQSGERPEILIQKKAAQPLLTSIGVCVDTPR